MSKDTAQVDTTEVASIHDLEPPPVEEDYVNPADKSPRWLLGAHAFALRLGATIGFNLGNRAGQSAPSPTKTIWLDSTLSEWKGKGVISADVWIPPPANANAVEKRPAVINFHGGGFILGQGTGKHSELFFLAFWFAAKAVGLLIRLPRTCKAPQHLSDILKRAMTDSGGATDDSRWAHALMVGMGAVVFSVNYRLAPGYPFPTPVEDCVDAILQICNDGDRYNIDKSCILLSGFSAGATLATSSWIVLQDPTKWSYELPLSRPTISGISLFYPLLDWTLDRPQKRAVCKRPDMTLPSSLTNLIDASYLHPPIPRRERTDIRLSPGLMPDELIDELPPIHLCLCEYDMLLAEGQLFAERVENRGRKISVRVVEGEKHAWDKPLPLGPKDSVSFEYEIAVEAIKSWFNGT